MTKKGLLTKILPGVLIFILVLTIVLVINSCTKTKKAPYGDLGNTEYASITIDGKKISISESELYSRFRYQGNDILTEEIEKIVFAKEIAEIKADIAALNETSESYKSIVEGIKYDTYGTYEDDEIAKLKADEKADKEQAFINKHFLSVRGVNLSDPKGMYQDAIIESYYLTLARENYAKTFLDKEVDDIESDYAITDETISANYDNTLMNKGDISAIVVKFSTSAEATAVLKELQLKFVKDKLYRVIPAAGHETDDYNDIYSDFSATAQGVQPLNNAEVLFEYVRMYNYMYSYRDQITLNDANGDAIDFNVFLKEPKDLTAEDKNYKTAVYTYIYNISSELIDEEDKLVTYDEFKKEITDQTNTKVNYTYDDLEKDTTIRTYLYSTIFDNKTGKTPYAYSATAASSGYFLAFKIKDCISLSYEAISTLAKFEEYNAKANPTADDLDAIATLINDLTELLRDQIKTFKDDAEKVKTYFVELANALDVESIINDAYDKTNDESIWNQSYDNLLTPSLISEKAQERLEDSKIVIYDPLLEILYASNNDFYKKSNASSPKGNVVARVTCDDKKTDITVANFYEIMEELVGYKVTQSFFVDEILKDKYMDEITKDEKEEFEDNYKSTMNSFSAGYYASYGFDASIGKKAFLQLYFGADNKTDAINNMWVTPRLEEIFIKENISHTFDDIYEKFTTLTDYNYDNFFSLTYQKLNVYTDDDEDGVADTFLELSDDRQNEVKALATELINAIYNELQYFSSSTKSTALSTIVTEYSDATRISKITEITADTRFSSTAEKASFLWGKYKKAGIFISADASATSTNADVTSIDDVVGNQLETFYNDYAKDLIEEDKYNSEFVARTLLSSTDYENLELATEDKLIITETGISALYITDGALPASAEFSEADNPDDDDHVKLYPYSTDEDDPYPDTLSPELSLYNDNDKITTNQLLVYLREYEDGVTSLTSDVTTAIDAFFSENVYNVFISEAFGYFLRDKLISEYTVTCSDAVYDKMVGELEVQKYQTFAYTNSTYAELWFNTFTYTRFTK